MLNAQILAEFFGTFILVLAILLSGNPLYIAAGFLAAITISGGGHLNPAVSLTMLSKGELTPMKTGQYVVAQIGGAFTALAVAKLMKK